MEIIIKNMFKSVESLKHIVINCDQNYHKFSEELKEFCVKTTVATDCCLHWHHLFGPKTDKPYETVINDYLNHFYDNYYSKTNCISKKDLNFYLTKNCRHLSHLYSTLNQNLFECLLYKSVVFEDLGNNCFLQVIGFAINTKVWTLMKTFQIKSSDKQNDKQIAINIENKNIIKTIKKSFTENSGSLKRVANEALNEGVYCVKPPDCKKRVKSIEIIRKSMLYSRQTSGRFKRGFILSKNCLQINELFDNIFDGLTVSQFPINSKKDLWPFLRHIIVRHKTCRFDSLLDKLCPKDDNVFNDCQELTNALNLSTNPKQVLKYIYSALHYVIPIKLFANNSNFKQFYNNCKLLVTCGLNTVLYVSDIKRGIKFNEIQWFRDLLDTSLADLISDQLIQWLIQYVLTILKTKFYITESTSNRSVLFFFRFDLWHKIQSKVVKDLIHKNHFQLIDFKHIEDNMSSDSSAVSNLLCLSSYRFVPKSNGFRHINRLKTRVGSDLKQFKNILQSTLSVLKKLRTKSSINCQQSLHKSLLKLKSKTNSEFSPKLYFIRADITDCYPSIDQKKMFEIIVQSFDSICERNEIKTKELDQIIKTFNKLFVKHIRYVETSDSKTLQEIAIENSVKLKDCILVPKLYTKSYESKQILDFIKTYIFKAFIKFGKNTYYHMRSGIRQGGMLSSELCSLYIESMVDQYFGNLGLFASEVRLIQADDFLFITPSQMRAKAIIEVMFKGFKDFNLKINFNKLKTNFDFNSIQYKPNTDLHFFGLRVHLESLSVSADYSIYCGQNIINSFNCSPNSTLLYILQTLLRQTSVQCSAIIMDQKLNDMKTVSKNIYERILLQSIRLSSFIRLSYKWKSKQNIGFVLKFSLNIAKQIYNLCQKWSQMKTIEFQFTLSDVQYIAVNAVLSQWTFGKTSNRSEERIALKRLKSIIESKTTKQLNNYLHFIPKKSLLKPFNQISV